MGAHHVIRPHEHRRGIAALGALLLAALLALGIAAPVGAAADPAARLVSLTNQVRSEAGVADLTVAADLQQVAGRHAQRMADEQRLHHNPSLGGEVSGYQRAGENVGRGGGIEAIHRALVASEGHYRNLVDDGFTEVGIAVVERHGVLWAVQVFREPTAIADDTAADDAPASQAPPADDDAPAVQDAPADAGTADAGADATDTAAGDASAPTDAAAAEGSGPRHELVDLRPGLDRMPRALART